MTCDHIHETQVGRQTSDGLAWECRGCGQVTLWLERPSRWDRLRAWLAEPLGDVATPVDAVAERRMRRLVGRLIVLAAVLALVALVARHL